MKSMTTAKNSWISGIAKAGLISKGIVYLVLGALAFMAAFELGGKSNKDTTSSGVFNSVKEWPAGNFLLILLSSGLICYIIWRFTQVFHTKEKDDKKRWGKKIRYIASGLAYASLAFSAIQLVLYNNQSNGDSNQYWAAEALQKPFGQWLLGIGALIIAGTGIYQIWYGLSEKYKKHIEQQGHHSDVVHTLTRAGKIGYVSRGIVWLLLAYLLIKAAIGANPGEAGDTGKAFQFLEQWTLGSYLLGALALGLIAYGIFNFLRAKYPPFYA
jgi:hypothetical protein